MILELGGDERTATHAGKAVGKGGREMKYWMKRCCCCGIGVVAGLAILGSQAALGQEPGGASTITVTARGMVEVDSDIAYVHLLVKTEKDTAQEAREGNKQDVEKVIQALKVAGVKEADIRVSPVNVLPSRPEEMMGFRGEEPLVPPEQVAVVEVTATVRAPDFPALDKAWKVSDAAVQAGAKPKLNYGAMYTPMGGLSGHMTFSVQNKGDAERQAIAQALAKARAKAEAVARGLGMKLGTVKHVSVGLAAAGSMSLEALSEWLYRAEVPRYLSKTKVTEAVTVDYECVK